MPPLAIAALIILPTAVVALFILIARADRRWPPQPRRTRLDVPLALTRTAEAAADREWSRRLPLPAPVDDETPRGAL